ncbi:MAG: universal stress protein [Rhodospirillales bacterium]|nr:universal stress protein [Rhodospirillales bacterium]MDH3917978.1 universal stress protein [Rhodospirillales bacterium]MDH3968674.1 universal stress protein [Rhodospirillales bacterium]
MITILVPLSRPEGGETVLKAAFAIAGRFDGHVRVLHVRSNLAEALHTAGMELSGSMRRSALELGERHAAEAADAVRTLFDEYCAANGISVVQDPPGPGGVSASWREETGKEDLIVARRGRLSDLVVMAQPDKDRPVLDTLEAALLHTGRPVLILPPDPPEKIGSTIALGWNGSEVAAKVAVAIRPLLAKAERVVVLTAPDGATASAEDMVEELAWHGISAEAHAFEAGERPAGTALLAEAKALGADVLVLGGYGKSRARGIIMGSVTGYMLAESDLPVLMLH